MSETTEISEENVRPQKISGAKATKNQEKFLLVLIIVILAGTAFILYRSGVLGGGASEKAVVTYVDAICSRDFDSYVSVMPEKIAAAYISDKNDLGLDGSEFMSRLYSDYFSEFGDNMSASIDFTGRSRPDDEYVDNFKQSCIELYGEEIKFSSVFEIDATVTFSGEKSKDDIELEFFVIKTGGKWCLVGADNKTEDSDA